MTLLAAVGLTAACGSGSDTANTGLVRTLPTWVFASWSGGARGVPNDRTDREAVEWQGQICPASHLAFDYNGVTLHFTNNCTILVDYGICLAKGQLAGSPVCAPDPLDSNTLLFKSLFPGNLGDFINAGGNLAVNFFYCSNQAQLVTGPVRCLQFR